MSKYSIQKLTDSWTVTMGSIGMILETFGTRTEAETALQEFERGERFVNPKKEVWLIGEFVIEPDWGGMQLGDTGDLDINQFEVVKQITQEEYDAYAEQYYQENGGYPGE